MGGELHNNRDRRIRCGVERELIRVQAVSFQVGAAIARRSPHRPYLLPTNIHSDFSPLQDIREFLEPSPDITNARFFVTFPC